MKQQHHPREIRTYNKGANRDIERELLSGDEGVYVDAHNMRPTSMDGDAAAIKRIGGEITKFPLMDNSCTSTVPNLPLSDRYFCMLAEEINGNIIDIWVEKPSTRGGAVSLPPVIRFNGVVISSSPDIPFTYENPLQWDKDDSCDFGRLFITDNAAPPVYLDITDMVNNAGLIDQNGQLIITADFEGTPTTGDLNSLTRPEGDDPDEFPEACTEKYFADLNIDSLDVGLESSLDKPVFVDLVEAPPSKGQQGIIIGNEGLPNGTYQYSLRYVFESGDRTQWSSPTPLIPVLESLSDSSDEYPYVQTFGGESDVSSGNMSVHLRFRVTNLNSYSTLELRRVQHNSGAIEGEIESADIIYKLDVSGDSFIVVDLYDNGAESLETLSEDDAISLPNTQVNTAKAIRYFDNRIYLMNITTETRELTNEISSGGINGVTIGATVQKLGKAGYNDPYNFVNYKTYVRGEGYTFGLVGYNANGEITFVNSLGSLSPSTKPTDSTLPDGFMPNRRDVLEGTSLNTSYFEGVLAENNNPSLSSIVTQTYEVFDHYDAISKTPTSNDKKEWGKSVNPFVGDFASPENQSDGNTLGHKFPQLLAYDSNLSLAQTVNGTTGTSQHRTPKKYNPKGFGLNYYAQGIYLEGIDSIPANIQSFSIVRSKPIKRVAAQGVGFYSLHRGSIKGLLSSGGGERKGNEIVFYSADTDSRISNDAELGNKIKKNPNDYEIEVVSGLGFFSEVYDWVDGSFRNDVGRVGRELKIIEDDLIKVGIGGTIGTGVGYSKVRGASQVDQIIYPRILRDKPTTQAEFNPHEDSSIGFTDGGYGYVGSKWRAINSRTTNIFPIEGVEEVVEGNSTFFRIKTNGDIYNDAKITTAAIDYNSIQVKQFHEPVCIVNIIEKSKDDISQSQGFGEFLDTGHYQKVNSIIGQMPEVTDNDAEYPFKLVDERWEDCIKNLKDENNNLQSNFYETEERFIYVTTPNGFETAWVNVEGRTTAEVRAIVLDLMTAGVNNPPTTVQGISHPDNLPIGGIYYGSSVDDSNNQEFEIVFKHRLNMSHFGSDEFVFPAEDSTITVRYDSRIPIRVFGGDGNIGENTFAMVDRSIPSSGLRRENVDQNFSDSASFHLNFPLPYPAYRYDTNNKWYLNHYQVQCATKGIYESLSKRVDYVYGKPKSAVRKSANKQIFNSYEVASLRQLLIMFTGESRTNTSYAYNVAGDVASTEFFPLKGYRNAGAGGKGGFTFSMNSNIDYSKEPLFRTYVSKPVVSVDEETNFCTRIIWSNKFDANQKDTPNLGTFPALNFHDLTESNGEIKTSFSANTGRGDNLYALTESGLALLMINKRTIFQKSGQELAVVGGVNNLGEETQGIQDTLWISQKVGVPREMWRTKAEYENALFFANKESVYKFDGNNLQDIGKTKYHNKVYRDNLIRLHGGRDRNGLLVEEMVGHYDIYHSEYWLNIPFFRNSLDDDTAGFTNFDRQTLVWSELTDHWLGTYGYNFNKYLSIGNETFGMKSGGSFDLNVGNLLDNSIFESYVIGASTKSQVKDKEFIRLRVNSSFIPRDIEFFDNIDQIYPAVSPECILDGTSALGSLNQLKDYYGFEQYIPRRISNRLRMQGRLLLFKINHQADEEFKVIDTELMYKELK